jgi:hypothetical protein
MRIYDFDYIITLKSPNTDTKFLFGLKGAFCPSLEIEKLANMLTKKIINKDQE